MPPTSKEDRALLDLCSRIDAETNEYLKTRITGWKRSQRLYEKGTTAETDTNVLFRANLINPQIRRSGALLTENKPQLDIKSRREGLKATAHILKKTVESLWDEQSLAMSLERVVQFAKVYQSGFAYIGWDASADYGNGNICLAPRSPLTTRVDPALTDATAIDQAQYVRMVGVVPLDDARTRFEDVADELKSSGKLTSTDEDPSGFGARIKTGMQTVLDGIRGKADSSAIPRIELAEYYVTDHSVDEDKRPRYPNGKVIVKPVDQDVICEVRPNIYYDGLWPLEWYDPCPALLDAWGQDEIEAVRRIHAAFNQLGHTYLKTVIVNAPPYIWADQNALTPMVQNTLRDMGNYVFEKAAGREVQRVPSPIPTSAYLQMLQWLPGLIDMLIGLQDGGGNMGTTRGRAEVRSAALLEGLQSQAQILIRAQARRFEAFLQRIGVKLVSRIFQFYTTDRLMSYFGSGEAVRDYAFERGRLMAETLVLAAKRLQHDQQKRQDQEDDELATFARDAGSAVIPPRRPSVAVPELDAESILDAIKGAWRDYRFVIQPYSSLAANRIARAQVIDALVKERSLPRRIQLEEAGYDNPKELLQEAATEESARQALGIMPAPPQGKKKK